MNDVAVLITSLAALTTSAALLITALAALRRLAKVGQDLNGRMDELLDLARAKARAEGILEGEERCRARHSEPPAGPLDRPEV